MLSIYSAFRCRTCKKEFVILSEDVDSMGKDRYLACPYCSSRRLSKQRMTDSLRECMKERSYKRNMHGALEQRTKKVSR